MYFLNALIRFIVFFFHINRSSDTRTSYNHKESKVDMFTHMNDEGKISTTLFTRKRGRPSRNKDYEWDDSDTFRLIELWAKEELLYNTSDVFYLHRDFRSQALTIIFKALVQDGVELNSPSEVRNKMNNLRNYYAAEKRKERKGAANDVSYQSNWKFYDHLKFLEDNYRPRATSVGDNVVEEGEIVAPVVSEVAKESNAHVVYVSPPDHSSPSMVERPTLPRAHKIHKKIVDLRKVTVKQNNVESRRLSQSFPPKTVTVIDKPASSAKMTAAVAAPPSSFMTVFRKTRKNSKVMYSMNESPNYVVETRPVVENSSKSFRMNRRSSRTLYEDELPRLEQKKPQQKKQQGDANESEDEGISRDNVSTDHKNALSHHKLDGEFNPARSNFSSSSSSSLDMHCDNSISPAENTTKNLDKCYADLIYQILVTMPDSVEKAMLKLDFQQKLINLKYSSQNE